MELFRPPANEQGDVPNPKRRRQRRQRRAMIFAILSWLLPTRQETVDWLTSIQRLVPVVTLDDERVVADLKINGSDSNPILFEGESYRFSWASANAGACEILAPLPSGITLNGESSPVPIGTPHYYPYPVGVPQTVTLTLQCEGDRGKSATDSVSAQIVGGSIKQQTPLFAAMLRATRLRIV